ncbi:GH25 family lysozyme [Sinomonas sp. JGH33]|uniref:GH25 family lysozyme n=1 Tax=Sinomonas terricola TaxID=3110330 RepID=A0ABU5T935_9MICC|nr:GH25 family lysozyme [Sinomonas sp. JGH33]MEA5456029.1 GH25 family lysozyme [Sinomonas sp. JGH33]
MPMGIDVSGWQGNVDWTSARANGAVFAYVKASEGNWTLNDYFAQQYNGSANAGMIRGAYHFARPNLSSGSTQANVFLNSGGGWSPDGITLPPALDLEAQPAAYGTDQCYGMTPAQLTSWTRDFVQTMLNRTTKAPMIYTGYYFWQQCLGGTNAFSQSNPVWLAAYNSTGPYIPGSWPTYTMWQYNDGAGSVFPGDQNVFNGSYGQLQALASHADVRPSLQTPAGATLLSGKWGGDGLTYAGWAQNGYWCLQMPFNVNRCFNFGISTDLPIVGDWTGSGTDGIGVVRNGQWLLANDATNPWVFRAVNFGIGSDRPIVGRWSGPGPASIGVVRGNEWILAQSTTSPYVFRDFYFGVNTDKPIVGDWLGNGYDTPGIVRDGLWMLQNSIWWGNIDRYFAFGIGSDQPVVGAWNPSATRATFGIVRNGGWYVTYDVNGNLSVNASWN